METQLNPITRPIRRPLGRKNYRTWEEDIRSILLARDLWAVVSGGEESPSSSSEWSRKNDEALQIIRIHCRQEIFSEIKHDFSAEDIWERLSKMFKREERSIVSKSKSEKIKVTQSSTYKIRRVLSMASASQQPISTIELLTENNYKSWEEDMRKRLMIGGLWGVVSGEESPGAGVDASSSSEWQRKNDEAEQEIRNHCTEEVLARMDKVSAKEAWEALVKMFEREYELNQRKTKSKKIKVVSDIYMRKDYTLSFEYSFPYPYHTLLTEKNYRYWKINMLIYFVDKGLSDVISEYEPRELYGISSSEWERKNAEALKAIRTFCRKEIFARLDDVKTAKRAWSELYKLFKHGDGHLSDSEEDASEVEIVYNQGTALDIHVMERGRSLKVVDFINRGDYGGITNHLRPAAEFISKNGYTALHAAVSAGKIEVVDNLLEHRSKVEAVITDDMGRTALALAAYQGRLEIAKTLIKRCPQTLYDGTIEGQTKIPLLAACEGGHVGMTSFLYDIHQKLEDSIAEHFTGFRADIGYWLILKCLESKMFGIALKVLKKNPRKMFLHSFSAPLIFLAETPTAFLRGNRFWKRDGHAHTAREILQIMLKQISALDHNGIQQSGAVKAMFAAVKNGNLEFVTEIIRSNPDMVWELDYNRRDILMCAIANRQEKVASFLYGVEAWRDSLVNFDDDTNNLLHMAGKRAPDNQLSRISGAALQMQRELQWFKEVENIVPEYYKECKNDFRQTPSDVFTKEHKTLVEDAEKWLKQTATSYSVVGALIITITFAAAFTVPKDDDVKGLAVFTHKVLSKIFLITDAISFSAASTSVMVFLGILTSRYAEGDFYISLPVKLIIGLITLFVSMGLMMIAFSAAVVILLNGEKWVIAPMILLALVPVVCFGILHFPLLWEIFVSTCCWKVFKKKAEDEPANQASQEKPIEQAENIEEGRSVGDNASLVEHIVQDYTRMMNRARTGMVAESPVAS